MLRLLDVAAQAPLEPGEAAELISASFLDAGAMGDACRGVSAIVYLGGLSTGDYSWDEYLEVNVEGPRRVLEAAHKAAETRVIDASSHHAVGFYPNTPGTSVPDDLYPRPAVTTASPRSSARRWGVCTTTATDSTSSVCALGPIARC